MRLLKRIYHSLMYMLHVFGYYVLHPIAYLFFGYKHPWIISEIDFDARDNGLHFYKYLCEKHKDINSYYLISRKNISYGKINKFGKTLEPYSLKHWLVFIAARVKISTVINGSAPSYYIQLFLMKRHHFGLNVSLKHGVIKNLHPNYFMCNSHLDMICCGSPIEASFINESFGYNFKVAVCTGLARFDNLFNKKSDNCILVMPTWRRWLDDCSTDEMFEQSEFYQKWRQLLLSSEFYHFLKSCNLNAVFYLHPKMNRFINSFKFLENCDFIKLANSKDDDDLQGYIIKSKALVTDYSSVYFDFAYSKKPVVYYQFDEERFQSAHYSKGYFDYACDGFGHVARSLLNVIDSLNDISDRNFELQSKYRERAEKFFPYYDAKSCERIYMEIIARLEESPQRNHNQ